MISLGSSAAASSGYSRDTVRARTQAFEDQTRGVGHRSTDSTASGTLASAASATSTATPVAIPHRIQENMDINNLVIIATQFKFISQQKNTEEDSHLAM